MPATIINKDEKFTAQLYVELKLPISNACFSHYGIYADTEYEALQAYFDYAIENDDNLSEDFIRLTLDEAEIIEATEGGYLGDYLSLDGVHYLSDIIMRDAFDSCQNCYFGDS
jgi:hypothetical protein